MNSPVFRRAAARFAGSVGRTLRSVFLDVPKWLGRLPLFRFLFASHVARLLFRYAVKPLALSAIVLPFLPDDIRPAPRAAVLVGVYLAITVLLNSPPGRAFEQTLLHALRVTVPRMTWDILVGLFRLVMNAFDRLLESVDRALYAVDEWLRFGATHGGASVAVKAALGIVWFYVAYVTRFAINLLVEPQINPIKHFPVVTVSHKIILPLGLPGGPLATGFATLGLSAGRADALAGSIVWGIPGIFGFLAWELKENWRLYRANRSRVLRPVRVGSHGETFAQLLRPGFHSGTLPKLFARVRKAARRARERSSSVKVPGPREREVAHHVQEDVRAFVERELVNLLNGHPMWADTPISAGEVELSATRIRIELCCDVLAAGDAAVLSFDQRDGYVIASIQRASWIASLAGPQAELLRTALVGFYKLAAVDLVAEHVRSTLGPTPVQFDVRRRALIVWPGEGFTRELSYDLSDASAPDARRLLFRTVDVPWAVWKRVWDARTPSEAAELTGQIAPGVEVLPEGCERAFDRPGQATGGFPVVASRPVPVLNQQSAAAPATS
jgi:hypothetical protein